MLLDGGACSLGTGGSSGYFTSIGSSLSVITSDSFGATLDFDFDMSFELDVPFVSCP